MTMTCPSFYPGLSRLSGGKDFCLSIPNLVADSSETCLLGLVDYSSDWAVYSASNRYSRFTALTEHCLLALLPWWNYPFLFIQNN